MFFEEAFERDVPEPGHVAAVGDVVVDEEVEVEFLVTQRLEVLEDFGVAGGVFDEVEVVAGFAEGDDFAAAEDVLELLEVRED